MIGPLLRSGNLTAYHPLGAVGNPVYLAAAQLRVAIARRLGPELADTFAIPQRNEDGDTVDWYAPRPGPVVPWSAASNQERTQARGQLLETRTQIETLGQAMAAEADSERQVFGRLLAHVTTFPNEGHIYLVDGRPVVTFWGFVEDQAAIGSDPLVNLDLLSAQATAPAPRRRIPWWLWAFAALLLIASLALLALRGCQPQPIELIPADTGADTIPPHSPLDPQARHLVNPELPTGPADEPIDPTPSPGGVRYGDRTVINRDGSVSEVRTVDADGRVVVDADAMPVGGAASDLIGVAEPGPDGESAAVGGAGAESAPVEVPMEGPVDSAVDALDAPLPEEAATDSPVAEPVEVPMSGPADEVVDGVEGAPTDVAAPNDSDSAADAEAIDLPLPEGTDGAPGDPAVAGPTEDQPPADPDAEVPPADPGQPPTAQGPGGEPEGATTEDARKQAPGASSEDPAASEPTEAAPSPNAPGAAADPAASPDKADPTEVQAPVAGAASVPTAARAIPSKRLLSSGWRTATTLQDPKTGLPIQMEYQLKDGAGKVRLKRHDGSVCESGASALLEGGKLVIDSSGNILCADGTNFGRPRVECKPGADGKARCRGSYPGGESFSIDMQQSDLPGTGQ